MARKHATKLSEEAIEALRNAEFCGSGFKLVDSGLVCYHEIKALVAALGGKWIKRTGTHEFSTGIDAYAIVTAACDRGEVPASNPLDFYPTPMAVVGQMVDDDLVSQIESLRVIGEGRPLHFCEPNGGSGSLVRKMREYMQPGDRLTICEMNPVMAAMLRKEFPQAQVIEGDFLEYKPDAVVDVVLMNPPFDGQAYQKHIRHAFSMLGRFGVLVAVAPRGFISNVSEIAFLEFVNVWGSFVYIDGLPFEGVKTPTCIIQLCNDEQNLWRDKPRDGFSTYYAYDAVVSIQSDLDMLKNLARCGDFAEVVECLSRWSAEINRHGSAMRMDENIAKEVLASLVDAEYVSLAAEYLESEAKRSSQIKPKRSKRAVVEESEPLQIVHNPCTEISEAGAETSPASGPAQRTEAQQELILV